VQYYAKHLCSAECAHIGRIISS